MEDFHGEAEVILVPTKLVCEECGKVEAADLEFTSAGSLQIPHNAPSDTKCWNLSYHPPQFLVDAEENRKRTAIPRGNAENPVTRGRGRLLMSNVPQISLSGTGITTCSDDCRSIMDSKHRLGPPTHGVGSP